MFIAFYILCNIILQLTCDLTPDERTGISHLHSVQSGEAMSLNPLVARPQSLTLKHNEVTSTDSFFTLYTSDPEDKRCNNNDYTEILLKIFLGIFCEPALLYNKNIRVFHI